MKRKVLDLLSVKKEKSDTMNFESHAGVPSESMSMTLLSLYFSALEPELF